MFILQITFQRLSAASWRVHSVAQQGLVPAGRVLHISELKLEVEWAHLLSGRKLKIYICQFLITLQDFGTNPKEGEMIKMAFWSITFKKGGGTLLRRTPNSDTRVSVRACIECTPLYIQ